MTKYYFILIFLSAIHLCSCGVDRTYEYEDLTRHNIWMYDVMKEQYLWGDKLPELTWKESFQNPDEYFAKLISKGDKDNGSYIVVDSLTYTDPQQRGNFNHINSYGMDFTLMSDPTNATTKTYARVISVFDGSPASEAGIKRNDFIETFDGYKITAKNASRLVRGIKHELVVRTLSNSGDTLLVWSDTRNISLGASTYVEDTPFPVSKVLNVQGQKVGYIMCNRLTENAHEVLGSTGDYKAQMDAVMAQMKKENPNQLILDLRLCNFGTLEMARRLASYIVPPYSLDKVFATTEWNVRCSARNETVLFDSSFAGQTLDLDNVAIITGEYTKGAAEWLIRALKFALGAENVLVVGAKTAGQGFMTQHIGDYGDMIHIYPAVAFVKDGNGDNDSISHGVITPTKVVSEFEYLNLYEYGDIRETLLNLTLSAMFNKESEDK